MSCSTDAMTANRVECEMAIAGLFGGLQRLANDEAFQRQIANLDTRLRLWVCTYDDYPLDGRYGQFLEVTVSRGTLRVGQVDNGSKPNNEVIHLLGELRDLSPVDFEISMCGRNWYELQYNSIFQTIDDVLALADGYHTAHERRPEYQRKAGYVVDRRDFMRLVGDRERFLANGDVFLQIINAPSLPDDRVVPARVPGRYDDAN